MGALLPALLILGAGEALLTALGLGSQPHRLDRGFDDRAAYLVPDPEVVGGWRTQMFDGAAPERTVAPRDGRRRVVLFGGSNTESFPHALLEATLNERATPGSRGWEVLNLGRNGYGSERVAILFEQAMALEPDVVVIYSGHNEFVEAGFRAELAEGLAPALRSAIEVASRLRTFNALCAALRPEGGARELRPKPEAWNWEYKRFEDLPYDATLERFERYRENLERMVRSASKRGIDVVLCTVISNALAPPFATTADAHLPDADRVDLERHLDDALKRVPERFRILYSNAASDRLHVNDWQVPARLAGDARVPTLRRWPAPVRAGRALLPAPERWSPRAWRVLAAQEAFFARELAAAERSALAGVQTACKAALALQSDHPLANFRFGLTAWLLGDDAGAVEYLDRAARYDRAPRKGNGVSNAIVRAVAPNAQGAVRLFDVAALYAQRAPDGVIGYELMKDECHLHERAYEVLMYDFADFLASALPANGDGE